MILMQTSQSTDPKRRIRPSATVKKRLVHMMNAATYGAYCEVELSSPLVFTGEIEDITCPKCIRIAGKKYRERSINA